MSESTGGAFYFGSEQRPLFGWLHVPTRARTDLGVVLCNPFGYESICAHRTHRHLAERAAQAGFAALRFDYDGTGDSAGDDYDDDRLQAWAASVRQAIDALKASAGVTSVCLIGTRLGATLATLATQGRSDVAALIAIAPVVKGRAFVRELRALALSRPQAPAPEWAQVDPEIQEAAGFIMTAATQKALQDVDLTTAPQAPAPRALLLERDDLPTNDAWLTRLTALGTQATRKTFSGYIGMTLSAHENVVPEAMVRDALAWLQQSAATSDANTSGYVETRVIGTGSGVDLAIRSDSATTHASRTTIALPGARESIVAIDSHLFGILTEPLGADGAPARPRNIVLVLNAGAISHIGPGRVYVSMARRLAQLGDATLRLDISGIGESHPHAGEPENSVYTERAQSDISATLDYLQQRYSTAPVHAVGICSGAFHSFKAAVAGKPFKTSVLINPLTYFWKEGMSLAEPDFSVASASARYLTSAMQLSAWLKVLRGQVNVLTFARVVLRRLVSLAHHAERELARRIGIPVQDDLARELNQAVQGAGRLYFIFGSSDPGLKLLREQGGSVVERLRRRGHIRIEVVSGADHTFTAHWARHRLIELLSQHLQAERDAP